MENCKFLTHWKKLKLLTSYRSTSYVDHVITEIVSTEETYVEDLSSIVEVFNCTMLICLLLLKLALYVNDRLYINDRCHFHCFCIGLHIPSRGSDWNTAN